jgi:hypothetical protein
VTSGGVTKQFAFLFVFLLTAIMSPSSTTSTARNRLASLSSQIMGSTSPSIFSTSVVPAAPEDALFGLSQAFRNDPSDKKVDLVIGAYRDDNAKPWILPVVRKVFLVPLRLRAGGELR